MEEVAQRKLLSALIPKMVMEQYFLAILIYLTATRLFFAWCRLRLFISMGQHTCDADSGN